MLSLNNITGSGLEISGIVSGSTISGSFVGDGSELTGVSATSFNIDGLSDGSAIIAGDKIFYSDAGTEKLYLTKYFHLQFMVVLVVI